jgi:M3 family oligoendopeptidase
MNNFKNFPYQRPNSEEYAARYQEMLTALESADTGDKQIEIILKINEHRKQYGSMRTLSHIRHTIDTKDSFYEDEHQYFDLMGPRLANLDHTFYQKLLSSPFKENIEGHFGPQLMVIAASAIQTFDPSIVSEMQEENKLVSEYVKLQASAEIEFKGEKLNLSTIQKFEVSQDREERKASAIAKWKFFEKQEEKVASIFDQLVKVRHRTAQKLGFENFVELGYQRMLRSDYNAQDVERFRDFIRLKIVPIASEIYEKQRIRLKLDTLHFYDEGFQFEDGNPAPLGDEDWIVSQAENMYAELSMETGLFFQMMKHRGLMDLKSHPGKATGGYCTFIEQHKVPFIFSNFNGTSADMDVLTHEAGHAFQVYQSGDAIISEYIWPTYEACEIHSMSMELFTMPWMPLFFGEKAAQYQYGHIANAIKFLPYGAAIDEFQHFVYLNPNTSQEDRYTAWRVIEQKYLPHRSYDQLAFLDRGTFWVRQTHLFSVPFYYIDYALAQICAFQFWRMNSENHDKAWKNYVDICSIGGSVSFLEIVRRADLESPFEQGAFDKVVDYLKEWLTSKERELFVKT